VILTGDAGGEVKIMEESIEVRKPGLRLRDFLVAVVFLAIGFVLGAVTYYFVSQPLPPLIEEVSLDRTMRLQDVFSARIVVTEPLSAPATLTLRWSADDFKPPGGTTPSSSASGSDWVRWDNYVGGTYEVNLGCQDPNSVAPMAVTAVARVAVRSEVEDSNSVTCSN
jgi:hypothetical protein